ncbi:MAG: two-component sensor histidine kinase [Chloroflexi bacterium]|nr:MAG: two-component sensor histidine kinase [Chloroflexota bacterium]
MQPPIDQEQAIKDETHAPAWVLDLLLGIAVTLVIALVISARQGGRQSPDALAYLFACAFGGLMLVRRRFPVAVLVLTMFLLFGYYTLDYPAIGLAVPVAAALYSAAELGHLTASIVVSLLLIVVSTYFRLREGQPVAYLLGYELVSTATLMAAAIALGDSTRARRALLAAQKETARLIEQEHAYRAEQRVQAERVRMARDLHDTIGHSISVISLHADVAREAIGRDDEQARQALAQIRTTSSDTMRELRATVKLLRSPTSEQPDRSIASLTNLSSLVQNAAASGLQVEVHLHGELAGLPGAVDTAAFRIIQEALTNIIRHADATRVDLTIGVDGRALRLQITDNGAARPGVITPGSGIAGMRERARLLGGTLVAEPQAAGGFAVNATLPLEDAQ